MNETDQSDDFPDQPDDLESMIEETISADAAPGLPTPLDADLADRRDDSDSPFASEPDAPTDDSDQSPGMIPYQATGDEPADFGEQWGPNTESDSEIPLPETTSDTGSDSPFVSPLAGEPQRQVSSEPQQITVNAELPDQNELMETMRQRLEPMFQQMESSFGNAVEDAFNVERELMDRRNVY